MQVLPGLPRLGKEGYEDWRLAMRAALVLNKCWDVVNLGVDDKDTNRSASNDATAKALIMLQVEKQFRPLVNSADNAKSAWDLLHRMHVDQGEQRQLQLRRDLATLRKARGEPMLVYLNRAVAIMHELTSLGVKTKQLEPEVVRQVLAGLRDHAGYTTIVKVITYGNELPSMMKVMEQLVEEERQLGEQEQRDGITVQAMSAGVMRGPKRCHICKKAGHLAARCPDVECYQCGEKGHIARLCEKEKKGSKACAMTAIAF